ncbi:hypothetical protein SKB0120_11750 [Moraxella osloensis]|jgi:glycosyltransferase involved in cell wall biosynthesis|nr:glycosyltransferase family A protein [Moraxella osloensis]
MKPLVTIIIPMFNEEKNIENCIINLNSQTNQNFNVCFIDDGSNDNTLQILQKFLSQNVDFAYEIVKQENKGAAAARETGIRQSKTAYVMFLDCDDKISSDAINNFIDVYKNYPEQDIYMPNLLIEKADNKNEFFEFYSNEEILEGKECFKQTLKNWKVHGCNIYNKQLLKKSYSIYHKFNDNYVNNINNDEYITRLNFFFANKVVRLSYNYIYVNNLNSTTKAFNTNMYKVANNCLIFKDIFRDTYQPDIDLCIFNSTWSLYLYYISNKGKITDTTIWIESCNNVLDIIDYKNIIIESYNYFLKYVYLWINIKMRKRYAAFYNRTSI